MFDRMTRTRNQVTTNASLMNCDCSCLVLYIYVLYLGLGPGYDNDTSSQGKISELECRGLRGPEVTRVAEKFREIDCGSDACVSFWEFAK
eukprot:scaffold71668_cov44-Prasinocladus_malaysianus.AAC.3